MLSLFIDHLGGIIDHRELRNVRRDKLKAIISPVTIRESPEVSFPVYYERLNHMNLSRKRIRELTHAQRS